MRRVRGFSLIEAMIVVVLIAGVALISLNLFNAQQRREQRVAMVTEQANEMGTMTRALEAYLESADTLPTDINTPFLINAVDLVAAGLLPPDFAYRPLSGRTTATSPLGQEYLLIGVNTAGGYRGAVVPSGDPLPAFLARAGLQATPESMREFGVSVMQRLKQHHLTAAGITVPGSAQINRDVSGFALDLSMLLTSSPLDPTVISLAGFPELRPRAPISIGDPPDPAPQECYAQVALNGPVTCNAGFSLAYEYELCADPSLPAVSEETTGAGLIRIERSINNFFHTPSSEMGSSALTSQASIPWVSSTGVTQTSAECPGATLRADNFQYTNPGNSVAYRYQLLWCASDGQYHDATTLARTPFNRGSAVTTAAPNGWTGDAARPYGYYALAEVLPGSGQTAPPSAAGLGRLSFMESGSRSHLMIFNPPVPGVYRTSLSPAVANPILTGQDGSVTSTATGDWTMAGELDRCVAESSGEAPAYLMSSPMGTPNADKRYFAWSIASSGPPITFSFGSETVKLDGADLASNHYCGSRMVATNYSACPTVPETGTRRVTTIVSGSAGIRRVGVCCN